MGDSSQPPDDKRLFMLLQDAGLSAEQAYTFVQELRTMAAENVIARFESKLDAQTANMDAQLKAQTASMDAQLKAQTASTDSLKTELSFIKWLLLFFLALATGLGLFSVFMP